MLISVVIITHNEELNLPRTLESVKWLIRDGQGEIIIVDSGSTDRTLEIAKLHGATILVEEWKGYAAQKNSAIEKAAGDWILSLDADEELDFPLQQSLSDTLDGLDRLSKLRAQADTHRFMIEDTETELEARIGVRPGPDFAGVWIPRKNEFLGRWIKHGGFWPDPKLRLFRRGTGKFADRPVHETLTVQGTTGRVRSGALLHHSYPTVADYIAHMNHYSSLGAEMVVARGASHFLFADIVFRPLLTFIYNYFFRLGFLDGRMGLQLHLNHAVYVFWKYAKAWELQHK
jgi:Glycosyltransferases involved in cell wall biogenesis